MTTIDAATFRDLQQIAGAEFVVELVDTFAEEAPQLLSELRSAWEAGAADRFRRAAHSLKSNGQTFGATEVAQLARMLETDGLPASTAPIDALQACVTAATATLTELSRG
jgi:histidine phosphotransfer protein HptB